MKPVNEADAEKMMEILMRMREEDPTWMIEQSKELKQTIVSGQGEFHLRTLKWRIENNDKLPIEFYEPKIPYRETITKAARADYRHKKQSGGAGQFGEVHLIVEPYYEGMPAPDTYRFGDPLRRAFATRHGNVFQAEIVQIVIRIKQPELFLAGTLLAFFFIHHADETRGIVFRLDRTKYAIPEIVIHILVLVFQIPCHYIIGIPRHQTVQEMSMLEGIIQSQPFVGQIQGIAPRSIPRIELCQRAMHELGPTAHHGHTMPQRIADLGVAHRRTAMVQPQSFATYVMNHAVLQR